MNDQRSTPGGVLLLGAKCVSWDSRKQNLVTLSTAEVVYVAATHFSTQLMWMNIQLSVLKIEV